MKEYFSYDILLNPFYAKKFNYIPGYVAGRLSYVSTPEYKKCEDQEQNDENRGFVRSNTDRRESMFAHNIKRSLTTSEQQQKKNQILAAKC